MASKLLICISANRTTVARWRGGRLGDCAVFAPDETGADEFRDYVADSGKIPAFIIVDAVEEDYRLETLPHASGSDRAQMVERKLRQYYRNSPYCAASLIGRDDSKRRDDRFLFSALTNPEIVTPWLNVLVEHELPVGGVFLLPVVTSGILPILGSKPHNLLLVAAHPAGIRLTFFRDGAFRLSRLSRNDPGAEVQGRTLIDEISNTRLYLHALRAATLDEQVSVVFLDHGDQLGDIARQITEENPSLQCSALGRSEIAKRLRLDPALIDISPATIYLQLLGNRTPDNNLASAAVTAGYRRHRVRRQLFAASAVAAGIGLAWSGANLWQQFSIQDQVDDTVRRTARINAEYQTATLQFPAAPTSADNLKRATELAEKLRTTASSPEPFLQVIGRALAPSPEIALTELGWQFRAGEIDAGGQPGATAPRQGAAPAGPAPAVRRHSGLLAGQVRDFRGDFRQAILSINAFAERLRADPLVESVRVVQLPLNVNPTLALSGNTAETPTQGGSADFRIVVVLKLPS
ncbi:MAG: hypothetical protein KF804_03765 [Burkholderiales bacterium]|jgi:hypothetical protein|nr:hypothetical protein [Burkholderiales bacterium]